MSATISPIQNQDSEHQLIKIFSEFREQIKDHLKENPSNNSRGILDKMKTMEGCIRKEINAQKGETCTHTLSFYARTQLRGISRMASQIESEVYLTGWQLSRMLAPIESDLTKIMELDGGDVPD